MTMPTFLLCYYAAGWAFIGFQAIAIGRVTLCDVISGMAAGGAALAIIVCVVGAAVYFSLYILAFFGFVSLLKLLLDKIAFKFPHVDITKFCLTLWEKP